MFHVLTLEYGRILPKLEPLNSWIIEELPLETVVLPQQEYRKKLNAAKVEAYKNWELPRGIVFWENPGEDGYSVIDGYHRTQAAKNQKLETAIFIVGS